MVEGGVFFVHYWMLHKWPWGKRNLNHALHHSMKEQTEMTSWSGYAFEAVDGASQGLPFVIFLLIVPIPVIYQLVSGLGVGIWTMYIHVGVPRLPWPWMGADFHYIHHRDNWFNFGLFTRFWDWLFGTLRDPQLEKVSKKKFVPGKIIDTKSGKSIQSPLKSKSVAF